MTTNSQALTEVETEQKMNAAFEKAGLPQNKINSLLDTIKSQITCDDECQKRKQADALKQKYNDAKKNVTDAPFELTTAEKNYYEFIEGDDGYNQMLLNRYTKTAKAMKKKSLGIHENVMTDIHVLEQDYEATKLYEKRMNELLELRMKQFKTLAKTVDKDIAETQTNDRKVIYEDHEFGSLHNTRKWTMSIYYFLVPCYLYYGKFFSAQKYKDIGTWILMILYCVFPLLLNVVVGILFYLKHQIDYYLKNKAPKNVYENI